MATVACGGSSSSSSSSQVRVSTSPSPSISAEWTEYHRDASRSGLGPSDPPLGTPAVAWKSGFDGDVYASPLIVNGHVIVATENNTVYSLDLFTGSVVWKAHLGEPVASSSLRCGDIGPVTGITGTPAADESSGLLYVVAFLSGFHHQLFAVSLTDGSVSWQRPVDPVGSTSSVQQQRGALAIGSGYVYIPLGGLYGDCGAYRGYVVGVSLDGAAAVAYVVPTERGAGIWSASGVSVGSDGSVYAVTGNATSSSASSASSASSGFAYSNSVLALSPDLTSLRSYFAPSNWAALDASDTDLGSVGASLLPGGLVVSIGKEGVAYVLRAGALGGVGGALASRRVCSGAWGGASTSGSMVFVPCIDGVYALSVSSSSLTIAWHTPHPSLGSPIVTAGAVWAIEPASGTLFALDLASGAVRYSLSIGAAEHFSTPAATDGFVVAPAGRSVVALSVVS